MRTQVQGVKRYFMSIWSVYTFVTGLLFVGIFLLDDPNPDWAVVALALLASVSAGIIGFFQGITLFVARQHDAKAAEAQLPCLDRNCTDDECHYSHD